MLAFADGTPLADALVEVFTDPKKSEGQRVAACRTGPDGKFCFSGLASGKYELRCSVNTGWNVTHVYLSVNHIIGKNKELQVRMSVGT